MVLTLADFDSSGRIVHCLGLLTSGYSLQDVTDRWLFVAPEDEQTFYSPAVGSLDGGDLEWSTGNNWIRIRLRQSGTRIGMNNAPRSTDVRDTFTRTGGSLITCRIHFQVEGMDPMTMDMPDQNANIGSHFLNLTATTAQWTWLNAQLTAGAQFLFAITTADPTANASFEATAGSPTASFQPEHDHTSDASFEAEAGSPTATFGAEAVAVADSNASFEAEAGDPTATFAVQFDHTSTVAFEAEAGSPTAAFTPEAITPPSRASFAARAGTPDVTIDVSFDHETRVIFEVRAGSPTLTVFAEAVRSRDPAAEALAHQVDHVNLSTTYRGDRMAEPLEKRAWDVRTYAVSLGEALDDSDVISRVDEVTVVDERGVPVAGYSTTGITSTAGIVSFDCSGGDSGDEHRVRIRCPLVGGNQRVEVTVPLRVLA